MLALLSCRYTRKSCNSWTTFTLQTALRRTGEDGIPLHGLYCLLYKTHIEPPSRSGSYACESKAVLALSLSRQGRSRK